MLGPVALGIDGTDRDLGSPKQRCVFAVLALSAGQVVSVDRLVQEVWGDEAGDSAVSTLQVYISRLRRSFGDPSANGSGPRLLRRPPGYLLDVPSDAVDGHRFARLVAAARGRTAEEPIAALRQLDEALELVAGTPLADVAEQLGDASGAEIARIEELVLLAREERLRALLGVGDAPAVVGEARSLIEKHPLREGLHASLILALYRAGRQTESLAAYEQLRRLLADELGIDPGPELRRLHTQLLRQDAALELPTRFAPPPPETPSDGTGEGTAAPQREVEAVRGSGQRARPSGQFVGRQEPLQLLTDAVGRVPSGGSVWLVSGEPGVGKTALVEEIAGRAASAGVTIAWGRSDETADAAPFWPWVQVLRSLPEIPADGAVGMLLGTATAESSAPAAAPIRIYDEISTRLTAHAAAHPTLVILEDAHWSDESSLELLAYLAERCADHPLMIIVTLRPVARPESPLGGLVARLARPAEAHRITLLGLPPDDIEQFLTQRLGADLSPEVVAATVARSDGNPFFALELARLAAAGGDAGADVPDSLRDVLLRRLAMLPQSSQDILLAASVAGRQCSLAELSAITGAGDLELDTAVTDATEAGLMTDVWRPRPGVRFAHALVRQALYERLRPMTRARWHAAAATWLQATGGDESDVDGLAHHLLESADLVGTPTVIPVVLQAARRANQRLAYEHAERLLERAVPLLDTMPRGPERDGLELRLQVQRGALAAARQGWTAPAALDAVRRAYELAGRAEPDREVFLTFYGAMFASIVAGDGARTHDMAEAAFDRRNAAGETGRHYELLGRWMRGSVAANRGDLDTAVPDLRRAIELADLDNGQLAEAFFHDPSTVIRGFLGMVLIAGGQVEDGQTLAKKSIELAEQSGNPFELSGMALFLAAGAAVLGDVATAHAAAVRSRALGEHYGFLLYAMAAAQIVGWAEAVAPEHGDPTDPRRLAGAGMIRAVSTTFIGAGARMMTTLFCALHADAELAIGQRDAAQQAVVAGEEIRISTHEQLWSPVLDEQRHRAFSIHDLNG